MNLTHKSQVIIVGGGFTGLTAAYDLVKQGISVTILESESDLGGLASSFCVGGVPLDRFYHHWFINDSEILALAEELGLSSRVTTFPTNTGIYCDCEFYRLSTPWDLLTFKPLRFVDRIRLGLQVFKARRVKNWKALEGMTASDWLKGLGGESVYQKVWEPLLVGKFGPYADQVSAVWFWNKLKLRGGSRGRGGEERLAYFEGGVVGLAEALAQEIRSSGGHILKSETVEKIEPVTDGWKVSSNNGVYLSERVIVTSALPLIADMVREWADQDYLRTLTRVKYLGNICLVLEIDRPLSDMYWLNVNDASFPFVGIIEHTNFIPPENYGGTHIVYLSKYLPETDPLFSFDREAFLAYASPYLKKMFPEFNRSWVRQSHLWRSRWSQPVVEKYYSTLIPPEVGPQSGFFVCSMAQVYPEDRGTNYAVRAGHQIAKKVAMSFD